MNLKPSIALGVDAAGNFSVLYAGPDAAAARDALQNLPSGIVQAEAYRRPTPWKRRKARPDAAQKASASSPPGDKLPSQDPEGSAEDLSAVEESPFEPIAADAPPEDSVGSVEETPFQAIEPEGDSKQSRRKKK